MVCNVWQHQTAGACIINFVMVCMGKVFKLSHNVYTLNVVTSQGSQTAEIVSFYPLSRSNPSIQKLQSETFIPKASAA